MHGKKILMPLCLAPPNNQQAKVAWSVMVPMPGPLAYPRCRVKLPYYDAKVRMVKTGWCL